MGRSAFILGVIAMVFVTESTCQFKNFRPPFKSPPFSRQPYHIIRTARAADNEPQPLWLHQGDDVIRVPSTGEHPFLPYIINDVKLEPRTRYARSLSPDGSSSVNDDDQETNARNTQSRRVGTKDRQGTRVSSSVNDDDQESNPFYYTRSSRVSTNDRQGTSGSRGHGTGATYPGYNRRNTRSIDFPVYATSPPINPWSRYPKRHRRTIF